MFIHSIAVLVSLVGTQPEQDDNRSKVVFPHPLITEVLAIVPRDSGDANMDGKRDAAGDEFVELMNPHEEPIELEGYRLSDRNLGGSGAVEFVFPSFRLEPGEIVVVFNGYGMSSEVGVGTRASAPSERHPKLGTWVFSMEIKSEFASFSNKGDWVLLTSPSGKPVHVISWGEFKEELPADEELVAERVEEGGQGSFCRYLFGGPMVGHTALDGRLFSPGRHPIQAIHAGDGSGR